MRAGSLRHREFVPLAALLISLTALSIDTMLPALPAIAGDLGATRPNAGQFVITALFLGFGIGQIVVGPLSDRLGRRPTMHAGLLLFMAGCLVSVFAMSFEAMIAGRVIQGIGVAAPRVVTIAMVRDQYEGREMARLMSFVMAVFILVPTVAPALGQGILRLGGWRGIFLTFIVMALIAFIWFGNRQPETLPAEKRRPFSARSVGRGFFEVLRIRPALGYTLATGFVFTPFIAYLSSAQQLFQEGYRTDTLFPLWFGVLALALGVASLVNGRLVMRHGMHRITRLSTLAITLISIAALVPTHAYDGLPPFGLFMAYLLAVFFGIGLTFGNLNALAMAPLGHLAGVGAAVVGALSILISVPLGSLVGQSFDGTMYAQIGAFALFGAATFLALGWAERG